MDKPYVPKILQELEDEIVELKDKIQQFEAEFAEEKKWYEKYRNHQPNHPDDERSWIPIVIDLEREKKQLESELSELAELILEWWKKHEFDTVPSYGDDPCEHYVYDNEPEFVRLAKKIKR